VNAPRTETSDLQPLDQERAIVERLKLGDRDAFAVLYGWYGDRLFRQAILPRLPNRELAEDCLRDTFRTALEKIGHFTHDNKSVFFWLRRIAINKATDVHRRHQRDQRLSDAVKADATARPVSMPSPDSDIEREQLRKMIDISLGRMNERYAQALRLRLLEDKDREECAQILGVTVGNFDVIFHRAAKAFRKVYPP